MANLTINETCPHCLKDSVFFSAIGCTALPKAGSMYLYNLIFQCGGCAHLMVTTVIGLNEGDSLDPLTLAKNSATPVNLSHLEHWFRTKTYPSPLQQNAPEHTPEKIAKPFIEAKDNFARGRYETSELLCRKALDIATKTLLPNTNDSLNARINKLKSDQVITADMADWAHIIRVEGNESAHSDDESTKEEAQALIDFTETFLLYAFTLPAMVRIKRGNAGHP
ncbi:DUF4145 domain-containing protein [Metapseudomonas otitidis]|uniref:DUF4145 domain-containing protein n=1 Tax=Metapseudomonas otitidis TaxID=319939 RepID=UPI001AAFFCCC|nr:DUF4145 domain-containing protein [Pseudomonas otitidis]MBO2926007.1 DUF4145 domain-containing protein [Pseudomonas otitidis]